MAMHDGEDFGLDRYVLGVGAQPRLDEEGFLWLSATPESWWLGPGVPPERASSLVGQPAGFVLLAPPFAGKSTVLAQLRAREANSVDIDLRGVDPGAIGERLTEAISNGRAVYLDALDEAETLRPGTLRQLELQLTSRAAVEVPWRLACRPYVWNRSISERLAAALPGFRELRLLPLDRATAARLVRAVGADPERFLHALVPTGLGRLAGTPRHFAATAERWAQTGWLPADASEAIGFEISRLLDEPDPARPRPLVSSERRNRLAKRLAAVAIFCGARSFSMSRVDQPDVVCVDDLPSDPDPDEIGIVNQPADFEAVLACSIFSPGGDSTLEFAHHQYAEYLAAKYIAERHASPRRLRAMLAVQDNGLLPRSLMGLAAWLTVLDPRLTAEVIRANAVELARVGVELPSGSVRAEVVAGIMTLAISGEAEPEWGLDLAPLAHPGLCDQLSEGLSDGVRAPQHLWWLARLAVVGECRLLVPTLIDEALAPHWPAWARGAAVAAVRALGDDGDKEQLRVLLRLAESEDPDDELLADAIETLYPDLLSTPELLEVLRPPRNDHLIGGYWVLLGKLADVIPDDDVAVALRWLADRIADEGWESLPERLIMRGWGLAENREVLDALASVLARASRRYATPRLIGRDSPPWLGGDERRRNLLVAVACELGDSGGWYDLLDLRLIEDGDESWLVAELPRLPAHAQPPLAHCLPQLIREPSVEVAEAILTMEPSHPAYEATQHLRGAVSLDSDVARHWRSRAQDAREADPAPTSTQIREWLLERVAEAEQDPESWWRVIAVLSVEDGDVSGESLFAHDLARRTRWALLDPDQQERVLTAGIDYLQAHVPSPEHWRGERSIRSDLALRDWAGVYLLTTLVRRDPDYIRQLDTDVWQRFAAATIGAWNYDSDEADRELRGDLVRMAPTGARRILGQEALDQLDLLPADGFISRREVYEGLIDEIRQPVADRLIAGGLPTQAASDLLGMLARHQPEFTIEVCRTIRSSGAASVRSIAGQHLAALDPVRTLDELASGEITDEGVLELAPHLDIATMASDALSRLLGVLLDHFPFENDPPMRPGRWQPDAAHRTREVRGRILNLLAERGAVPDLEASLTERSELAVSIIKYYIRMARARAADLAFEPLTPRQVVDLLSRPDVRLVRGDGDLVDVIEETIVEAQSELAQGGAFREIWDAQADGTWRPQREDDVSDWLARRLRTSLDGGSIVDREVQVTRPGRGGIGTRFDIAATRTTATLPANVARVTIEAKLLDHDQLLTALEAQLARRYLSPTGRRHGIYLVYWIAREQLPSRWPAGLTDQETLLTELQRQAVALEPEFVIRPIILDISRPGS